MGVSLPVEDEEMLVSIYYTIPWSPQQPGWHQRHPRIILSRDTPLVFELQRRSPRSPLHSTTWNSRSYGESLGTAGLPRPEGTFANREKGKDDTLERR